MSDLIALLSFLVLAMFVLGIAEIARVLSIEFGKWFENLSEKIGRLYAQDYTKIN